MSKLNLDVHRYAVVPNSIVTKQSLSHQRDMSYSIIVIVQKIQELIISLDRSNLNYEQVLKQLKGRQQAMVFSLLIRTFRYCLFSITDLNKILDNFKSLEVYPMNPGMGGGMDKGKSRLVLPIFNNKALLFSALRIRRLFSSANLSF